MISRKKNKKKEAISPLLFEKQKRNLLNEIRVHPSFILFGVVKGRGGGCRGEEAAVESKRGGVVVVKITPLGRLVRTGLFPPRLKKPHQ